MSRFQTILYIVLALAMIAYAIYQARARRRDRAARQAAAAERGLRARTGPTAYEKRTRLFYALVAVAAVAIFLLHSRGSPRLRVLFESGMRAFFYFILAALALLLALLAVLLWTQRDPVLKQVAKLVQTGRHDEALALLRALVRDKGETPTRLNALGLLLMERGQLDEALEHLRRAEHLAATDNTRRLEAVNNQAVVLYKLGRLDEALARIAEACAAAPLDVVAACNHCHFLADAGREREAYDELERAEQILDRYDPGAISPMWRTAIAECRQRLPTARGFPVLPKPPP